MPPSTKSSQQKTAENAEKPARPRNDALAQLWTNAHAPAKDWLSPDDFRGARKVKIQDKR